MYPSKLKLGLGLKRKESGLRHTKLTLACNQRVDLENMQNFGESDVIQKKESIKSNPTIEICSPKMLNIPNTIINPLFNTTNRPVSSEKPRPQTNLSLSKELVDYKQIIEQYKLKVQCLTAQNDFLKNRGKVLQVQLNNFSKDYYDRQINRLKNQCETHQISNINLQHLMQSLTNQKNQLQVSIKKNVDQIKNYIKQVQKQKMTTIELRNQIHQKEKTYKRIMEEGQKSNEFLSQNYQELTQRYMKLQNDQKEKIKNIQSLQKHNQIINNRFKQNDLQSLSVRKKYQSVIAQKDHNIQSLNIEYQQQIKQLQDKINNLNTENACLKEDRVSTELQNNRISFDLKVQQSNLEQSLQIEKQNEQIKQLTLTLDNKSKLLENYQNHLKKYYSPQQYLNLQKKCKQSEDKRLSSSQYYEQKLYSLQKQVQKYKFEKLSASSSHDYQSGISTQKQGCISFNQILKRNIQENTTIKQQLRLKIQEVNDLKSQILEMKIKEKSYLNDIQILNKRIQSQQKNIKISLDIEHQNYINEIDSLKRKLHTLETRLEYKVNENKEKDKFIKNTIIGRCTSKDIPFIVNELERIFLEKEKMEIKQRASSMPV